MGKMNKQRRAEKRRAEARRAARVRRSPEREEPRRPPPVGAPPGPTAADIASELFRAVAACWERGWQPADLAHVAKRRLSPGGTAVCADVIGAEAGSYRTSPGADAAWVAQVDAVASDVVTDPGALVDRWARTAGSSAGAIAAAAEGLRFLRSVPTLPRLVDPPKAWSRRRSERRDVRAVGDPKMAARVRALLAKAESTQFEEEAEALTAKAQELIAKHAIDQAMLDGGRESEVIGRRVLLDSPYVNAKSLLVGAVARANRCRTVIDDALGFVTVFGYPSDLDAVELLHASLLTQATAAMVVAGRSAAPGRLRSFRYAFLVAFAHRIGQRLRAATAAVVEEAHSVHGAALVPVLAARVEAVEAARDAAFGRLTRHRTSVSNAAGYAAGRAAADLADLGPSGRLKAG